MTEVYDIAIIGAGPAGTVLAKELSLSIPELKILLVDSTQKKVCGGLLAPDAQKALATLGLTLPNSVLADPQIFDVETIDLSSRYVRNYQRHYLNMDRAKFDAWLLSLSGENVTVVRGLCASIEKDDNIFKIQVRADGKETEYTASSVAGADGAKSIVRSTFFEKNVYHYVAIQERFKAENSSASVPPYACIFDKTTSDSCSWLISKDGETIFGGAFKIQDCRRSFEEQKLHLEKLMGVSLGKATDFEACLLTHPRKFSDFLVGKESVYLLGEAAGFISASSFEGISYAITSAVLLAEAFRSGATHTEIHKIYKRKTLKLRLKLYFKIIKGRILCSPLLRKMIMKSGIKSIKKDKK